MTLLALPGCRTVRRPLVWPEPVEHWRPANPGDTPGSVEPDDDLAEDPDSRYFETHVKQPDDHECTPDCPMWPARYDGPVLLGRRGEEVR